MKKGMNDFMSVVFMGVSIWTFVPWLYEWPVTPRWFWFVAGVAFMARALELAFRKY